MAEEKAAFFNPKRLKQILRLAWPSILENLATTITNMIDTFMVSPLGTAGVAAVGLTVQPVFLLLAPVLAAQVAVAAIVARRRGAQERQEANRTVITVACAAIFVYLVIFAIVNVFGGTLLRLLGSNPEIHDASLAYFRILMSGSIFNIMAMIINSAQSGSGNTRVAFVSNVVMSLVNMTGNAILIYGLLGFPALGVTGAAIASVLGQAMGFLVSLRSLFKKDSFVNFSYIRKHHIRPAFTTLKAVLDIAVTIFIENILMRLGFMVTAMQAASLGTDTFAVHNAGMNLLNVGFSLANGMQTAVVASVGNALGAKRKDLAMEYGRASQQIGVMLAILWSFTLFFFGRVFFGALFADPTLVDLGIRISRFNMVIVLVQIQNIIISGALRAAGDVRYTLFASTLSVTVIRSLVTILLVSGLGWGLDGIWIGIFSHQFSSWLMMRHRFNQGKWVELKI
ncbi:MAG: MATE family efflux transporter [Peptoniphilaceae bacterium]|nr:MATE family efflux transporter [Peptoniphilaceae bacterium]